MDKSLDARQKQKEEEGIVLNQRTAEEFHKFGKPYFEEAKRILTYMPRLPSKYNDEHGTMLMAGGDEASKLNTDELMARLQKYVNDLLQFSPLIANLFFVRDFLTCNKSSATAQNDTAKPNVGRAVIMNTSIDFDDASRREPNFMAPFSSMNMQQQSVARGAGVHQFNSITSSGDHAHLLSMPASARDTELVRTGMGKLSEKMQKHGQHAVSGQRLSNNIDKQQS